MALRDRRPTGPSSDLIETVYREHLSAIVRYLRRRLEDAAAEVFTRAIQADRAGKVISLPWLFGVITPVVLAGSVSAGIAIADVGSSTSPSGTLVTVASADQVAAFGVLGTPSSSADNANVFARDAVVEQLSRSAQAILALARRIGVADRSHRTWLVPGGDQLCTVAEFAGRVVVDCVSNSVAAAGEAVSAQSGGPSLPAGSAIVSDLLPDGASNVSISTSDGSVPVEVVHNWVEATVKDPTALQFDLAGDRHVVPIGSLPS
ncbi:MAG: hypothetical protein QOK49_2176 [Baekduia sp.]|jgi:hypothetical protein|nr:hypothetical protein [Pseudonocardiales bacterium]MDX6727371.1 hypothetical protein [Baekduia sp.]MEA2481032.1 hypothetical protein [Thermoleophilaceae bacterium]